MKHAIVALLPLKEAVGTCRASLVPYPCLIDSGIRRMRQRLLDGLHAVHRPARPPHSWHPLEAIVASCTVDSYLHGAKRWQETLCLPSSPVTGEFRSPGFLFCGLRFFTRPTHGFLMQSPDASE
jgi:hypothetical protein